MFIYLNFSENGNPDQLKVIIEEGISPKELTENFNATISAKKAREQRLHALLKRYDIPCTF